LSVFQIYRASDITIVPMARGFVYLVAIIDLPTCKVLTWRFSNTFTSDLCVEAWEEPLNRYETPKVFNTDQGSRLKNACSDIIAVFYFTKSYSSNE